MLCHPFDDERADVPIRAVDDGSPFQHRVSSTTIDAIIVGGYAEHLIWIDGFPSKRQMDDAISHRAAKVDIVSDTFGSIEVEAGNVGIHQLAWRGSRTVREEVPRRMF